MSLVLGKRSTDFIRAAFRNQLDSLADLVRQSMARKTLDIGLAHCGRSDLEMVQNPSEIPHINVPGMATIARDLPPEPASTASASVTVLRRATGQP
jgi:hypothetical protein